MLKKENKIIQRGEVYWINLPIDNKQELQGKHPAVIISNNEQNKFSPLITIIPLTSQIDKIYPFQVFSNLQNKKGIILVDQIRTIDRVRLGDKIDKLSFETMNKIEKTLHLTLDLKS